MALFPPPCHPGYKWCTDTSKEPEPPEPAGLGGKHRITVVFGNGPQLGTSAGGPALDRGLFPSAVHGIAALLPLHPGACLRRLIRASEPLSKSDIGLDRVLRLPKLPLQAVQPVPGT